ncbi:GTPase-activating protein, putative [Entamoeba histolytica HM-1:IMSS]|uniref:GTPase-activating protein, putative n=1 Tax=Entamoeba histolytica (strain ATCC 30459 / HM-1:IMSS / ABRM) TaxID=294381 RepID=B1N5X8_ENTH1|nr:GTPase-activating protein, putative [Entamoeba histolytica HM-1:IMSS]EDS88630.1 GTPase-activating protein, putative [Entamoeba histolytica HM-1:IMSS]|eukprot:XP_001914594.1 GTPase-activating protein, putative [Entamoeba histolytica HM-1:IMSS]
MSEICDWVQDQNDMAQHNDLDENNEEFLHRLFSHWSSEGEDTLTLSDLVDGLNKLYEPDLMTSITNFFQLYSNDDGKIDREGILQISEDLLYLTTPWKDGLLLDHITEGVIENAIADEIYKQQKENGANFNENDISLPTEANIDKEKLENQQMERYLSAASTFIQRSFEYAQPEDEELLIKDLAIDNKISHNAALNPNTPVFVNLPTFRMVVLADETYELFFSKTLRTSIHVSKPLDSKFNTIRNLRDMFDGLLADGRKVANKVRRRMDSAATSTLNNPNSGGENATLKSSSPEKSKDEEDERDDDFGVISIDEKDKDILLGAEGQVSVDPIKNSHSTSEELSKFRNAEDVSKKQSIEKGVSGKDKNLIEFET